MGWRSPSSCGCRCDRMQGVSTNLGACFRGLLFESFRHHGNSFVLPTKQLAESARVEPGELATECCSNWSAAA